MKIVWFLLGISDFYHTDFYGIVLSSSSNVKIIILTTVVFTVNVDISVFLSIHIKYYILYLIVETMIGFIQNFILKSVSIPFILYSHPQTILGLLL